MIVWIGLWAQKGDLVSYFKRARIYLRIVDDFVDQSALGSCADENDLAVSMISIAWA